MTGRLVKGIIWVLAAFALGIGFSFLRAVNLPASPKASGPTQEFTIAVGEGPRTIAKNLLNAGLLHDERPFYVYVLLTNKRNSFYPGTYELDSNSTIRQLVKAMSNEQKNRLSVTVIEGWRINDIAAEVAKKTKVTEADFLAAAPVADYEGYLFPDTYFFTAKTTASEMVKVMRDNFDLRTKELRPSPEDVILASIIEREAKHDTDRAKIAGLYQNRLAIDMALQADPTVQYGKGSWASITLADYQNAISPYNTYLHKGLPPTAISSPGLKSLQAVMSPEKSDYYYFFNIDDGTTIYSKTLEEHNANKRKYLN